MAAHIVRLCGLLAVVVAAYASPRLPSLEVNTLSVVHGAVVGMPPGSACATISIELELGQASHQAVACPDGSGAAPFAVLLAAADGRPARVMVKQPGAAPSHPSWVWQKLVNTCSSVPLTIDMLEAQEEWRQDLGAGPSPGPAHTADPQGTLQRPLEAAPTSPGSPSSCACPRRTHTELEDVGERSVPLLLALAAPMCPPPTTLPTEPLPTAQPLHASLPLADASPLPPPSLLLPGLGAACSLQAVALAALLLAMLRRRRHLGSSSPTQGADSAAATAATVGRCQEQACGPARRLSLRDACTSPLVSSTPLVRLLASPFVGAARQRSAAGAGAGLDDIPEGPGAEEDEVQSAERHRQHGWSQGQQAGGAGGSPRTGSFAGLPPPPVGWTRDAHGRLLRQTGSGAGWGGFKPALAVQHPPPFGAPAGSAYRSLSEQ